METTLPDGERPDLSPEEVFEILGNEIRMGILRALWEAYDPLSSSPVLSFSALYDAVPVDDSGQFSYHLDKLRGRYIEQTDDGYRLRPVGLRLIQSVIAGAGREGMREPAAVDIPCPVCDSETQLVYDGGRVYHVCTACAGHFESDEYPEGTLWGKSLSPAGVAHRSPEELFAALSFLDWPMSARLTGGVCPRCSGVLEQSLAVCEHHDAADGPCQRCGYSEPIRAHWVCLACKHHATGSVSGVAKNHPAVIAFRHEHDIDFGYPYAANDFETVRANEAVRDDITETQELCSTDPVEVCVTIGYEDDSITLTFDGDLAVVDVSR